MTAFDAALVAAFKNVLNNPPPAGRQKEQVVQDYLEQHTELIPTPNRLNHHLHFQSVVSKFPLGTELTTDYLYITKSSDTWRITLVELESPDKSIFTADTRKTTTSAEFNAALNQVRSWKHFLADNKDEVLRRLEPLLRPVNMRCNPVEFHYQLIIGGITLLVLLLLLFTLVSRIDFAGACEKCLRNHTRRAMVRRRRDSV